MRITGGVFCSTSVPALLRCPSYKVNYYVFLNGCGKKKLAFLACSVPCLHRSLVFGGQSLLLLPAEYQGKKGLCLQGTRSELLVVSSKSKINVN